MKPREKINIKKRVIGLGFVLALFGWLIIQPIEMRFHGMTMGTSYQVKAYRKAWHNQGEIKKEIEGLLVKMNQSMSTYDPKSTISRFNNSQRGQKTKIDPMFYQVLVQSKEIYQKSNGMFDPTVWTLYKLWGFGTAKTIELTPSADAIQSIKKDIGFNQIKWTKTHLIKQTNATLDFSAIAKGYAVDQMADTLEQRNINAYFIEIGGEVRVGQKKPNGNAWVVGVTHPDPSQLLIKRLELEQKAIATSGDYRNFQIIQGKKRQHIINPKTGYPVDNNIISVSVIAKTCMLADGLATALMGLTYQEGQTMMNHYPGVTVIWFVNENGKMIEKKRN